MIRTRSLRSEIVTLVIGITIIASAVFGLVGFVFAYSIEDRLFESALKEEVQVQKDHWAKHGTFARLPRSDMAIYRGINAMPGDLRNVIDPDVDLEEYPGNSGRHYHVARFELPKEGGIVYLVGEVSQYLQVRPRQTGMLKFQLLITGLLVVLAALVAWFFAGRATSPLVRLASEVEGANTGIPVVSATSYPANEVGTLARALERSFERIGGFLEREKQFTRDVSHELRTPLAVMRSGTELSLADPLLEAGHRLAAERTLAAAQDMEQILELLLRLAREEAGGLVHDMHRLLPLVEKAILAAAIRFPASKLKVEVAIDPQLSARTNPVLAQLILNNLVGNVFQHVRDGKLTIAADGPNLTIGDQGTGLKPHDFALYAKGEASSGSGLGLSIVQRLCGLLNIRLFIAATQSPGTTVRLEFPEFETTTP